MSGGIRIPVEASLDKSDVSKPFKHSNSSSTLSARP